MSPFFTRKGDEGYTSLFGEKRYSKSDPRFDLLGTIDEAAAAMGLARSLCHCERDRAILLTIQKQLSLLMGDIAEIEKSASSPRITHTQVAWLEETIQKLEKEVSYPHEFIFQGDDPASAALDLARAITRRAERLAVHFKFSNVEILYYLNRLSSLCFVLELAENQENSNEGASQSSTPA